MSVGQEFALRWLHKNAPLPRRRKNLGLDEVAFCGRVARAIDAYAERKRAEFEEALQRGIVAALDDETAHEFVQVTAGDLLESECMTFVASEITSGIDRPRRFPSNRNLKPYSEKPHRLSAGPPMVTQPYNLAQ